ncbi:MAG: hypothetical protein OEX77_02040 [Candidatus Bathyarchaeota archaeon]|nr:hypothetical protein [Candidatus Bathyarchaeota archaeon]MDH5732339.1 hypothetical protein [Candidatus Bathyarchaeota archaeon]
MNKISLAYALFVISAIVILASLPLLVGKIDPNYLLFALIAIGVLWFIARIYMRKKTIEGRP